MKKTEKQVVSGNDDEVYQSIHIFSMVTAQSKLQTPHKVEKYSI